MTGGSPILGNLACSPWMLKKWPMTMDASTAAIPTLFLDDFVTAFHIFSWWVRAFSLRNVASVAATVTRAVWQIAALAAPQPNPSRLWLWSWYILIRQVDGICSPTCTYQFGAGTGVYFTGAPNVQRRPEVFPAPDPSYTAQSYKRLARLARCWKHSMRSCRHEPRIVVPPKFRGITLTESFQWTRCGLQILLHIMSYYEILLWIYYYIMNLYSMLYIYILSDFLYDFYLILMFSYVTFIYPIGSIYGIYANIKGVYWW